MNFKSQGLIISIIILICMILICHITNFLYKNKHSDFIDLSLTNKPVQTQYNNIYYPNNSCSDIGQAEIPLKIISGCQCQNQCQQENPTTTKYELSDSELADVYKYAYETAGLNVMTRTLAEPRRYRRNRYYYPYYYPYY